MREGLAEIFCVISRGGAGKETESTPESTPLQLNENSVTRPVILWVCVQGPHPDVVSLGELLNASMFFVLANICMAGPAWYSGSRVRYLVL